MSTFDLLASRAKEAASAVRSKVDEKIKEGQHQFREFRAGELAGSRAPERSASATAGSELSYDEHLEKLALHLTATLKLQPRPAHAKLWAMMATINDHLAALQRAPPPREEAATKPAYTPPPPPPPPAAAAAAAAAPARPGWNAEFSADRPPASSSPVDADLLGLGSPAAHPNPAAKPAHPIDVSDAPPPPRPPTVSSSPSAEMDLLGLGMPEAKPPSSAAAPAAAAEVWTTCNPPL